MMGWCPFDGEECHHDGYCEDCEHYVEANDSLKDLVYGDKEQREGRQRNIAALENYILNKDKGE